MDYDKEISICKTVCSDGTVLILFEGAAALRYSTETGRVRLGIGREYYKEASEELIKQQHDVRSYTDLGRIKLEEMEAIKEAAERRDNSEVELRLNHILREVGENLQIKIKDSPKLRSLPKRTEFSSPPQMPRWEIMPQGLPYYLNPNYDPLSN